MTVKSQKVIAIIQARMSSSRLPGKVLIDLEGKPVLERVYTRTAQAEMLDQVLIATSVAEEDNPIAAFCRKKSIPCFRGSGPDVLDRIYQAAKSNKAEIVVRITGDCPLIDPGMIDECVRTFLQADPPVDFVANRLPGQRTIPIGLDTEVCSFAALEKAWTIADKPYQREHVMPFLYEDPGRFRILRVDAESDYGHLRWTLDTEEDLQLLREIYQRLGGEAEFSWREVIALMEREPSLALLNADVLHRTYRDEDPRDTELNPSNLVSDQ